MQSTYFIFSYLLNTITHFLKPSLNSSRTTSYVVHFFSVGSASSDKQPNNVSLCSLGSFVLYFLTSITIARDETNAEDLVFKLISLWDNRSALSFNLVSMRFIKTLTKKIKERCVFLHCHHSKNTILYSESTKMPMT